MQKNKLLIIGALPDTKRGIYGGATVLMRNFLSFLEKFSYPYQFVRTNRYRDKQGNLRRTLNKVVFLVNFLLVLPFHKVVMFNFSDNATVNMYPFLSFIARVLKKKVVLRKFGGSFDIFLQNISATTKYNVISALEKSDLILFETKAGINHLQTIAPLTHGKIMWFPNVRQQTDIKNLQYRCKRLVFFGHVQDEKGIGDLLKLASLLPKDYKVEIYGRIIDCKYQNFDWNKYNVSYNGEVPSEKVLQILATSLALILPSYREGYPGVIIEAFSVGTPVIAYCIGGIPEIVEDGQNGRLCSLGDIDELREAVLSFNEQNYSKFCRNALDCFDKYLNAENVNECIYKRLQELF